MEVYPVILPSREQRKKKNRSCQNSRSTHVLYALHHYPVGRFNPNADPS